MSPSTSVTVIVCLVGGLIAVTTPLWAASIHVVDGENLVNVIRPHLMIGGGAAIASGLAALAAVAAGVPLEQLAARAFAALRRRTSLPRAAAEEGGSRLRH